MTTEVTFDRAPKGGDRLGPLKKRNSEACEKISGCNKTGKIQRVL